MRTHEEEDREALARLRDAAPTLLAALKAIRDYEPNEVCCDEFAYNRMVEAYRDAAKAAIAAAEQQEEGS